MSCLVTVYTFIKINMMFIHSRSRYIYARFKTEQEVYTYTIHHIPYLVCFYRFLQITFIMAILNQYFDMNISYLHYKYI